MVEIETKGSRPLPVSPLRSETEAVFDSLRALQSEVRLGDPEVCVAVLDGPVDLSHPCFRGANLSRVDTLVQDAAGTGAMSTHGTHVTSVILGQPHSGTLGIAARCRGVFLPVFRDSSGYLSQLDLARAIERAVLEGAHVINVSGGEKVPKGDPDPILARALNLCDQSNVLVVAATGNDGCDCLHVPAAVPPALAVGAMDRAGAPVGTSNFGEAYRTNGVLAPGEAIPGAVPGGGIAPFTGSSFATPIVSGLAALLMSVQRRETGSVEAKVVRDAILDSAIPCPPDATNRERYLAGTLNVHGAYALTTRGGRTRVTTSDARQTSHPADPALSGAAIDTGAGIAASGAPPTPGHEHPAGSGSEGQSAGAPGPAPDTDAAPAHRGSSSLERGAPRIPAGPPQGMAATAMGPHSGAPHTSALGASPSSDAPQGSLDPTASVDPSCDCGTAASAAPGSTSQSATQSGTGATPSGNGTGEVAAPPMAATAPGEGPTDTAPAAGVRVPPVSRIFAIGNIGFDFGTEARRDTFRQLMPRFAGEGSPPVMMAPNPYDVTQLADYLDENPYESTKVIWTLNLELTPIYALEAEVTYAEYVYQELRTALRNQALPADDRGYVSRVSIPGVLTTRTVRLFSGQIVPVVVVQPRGLYIWNEAALVDAVVDAVRPEDLGADPDRVRLKVRQMLDKVYYQLRNLGQSPPDRAINFQATNAFTFTEEIARGLLSGDLVDGDTSRLYTLDNITAVKSPYCRVDSDCWDVQITFFDAENDNRARVVFQSTIDVSDELPVQLAPTHQFLWAA